MALKRFIIDAPREPTIHDVVDRIMANIEAEGAYKVPNVVDAPVAAPAAPAYPSYDDEMRVPIAPWQEAAMQEIGWAMDAARPMRGAAAYRAPDRYRMRGAAATAANSRPIAPMPRAQAAVKPDFVPGRPYARHGNYVAPGWTSGHSTRPDELMRNEDFQVPPVDSYDESGYWHDFAYDQAIRDYHLALTDGYAKADALANLHYRMAEADRVFAREAPHTSATTFPGKAMQNFDEWTGTFGKLAADRESIAGRLAKDSEYRRHIDSLTASRLVDHFTWTGVKNEIDRLGRLDRERELRTRFPGLYEKPQLFP